MSVWCLLAGAHSPHWFKLVYLSLWSMYVAVALLHKATCNNRGVLLCMNGGGKERVDEVRCCVLADLHKAVWCQTHHRHFFHCHYFTEHTEDEEENTEP